MSQELREWSAWARKERLDDFENMAPTLFSNAEYARLPTLSRAEMVRVRLIEVRPLTPLEAAQQELTEANETIRRFRDTVTKLEARIEDLEAQVNQAEAEKALLARQVEPSPEKNPLGLRCPCGHTAEVCAETPNRFCEYDGG